MLMGDREGLRLKECAEEAFLFLSVQTPTSCNSMLHLVFTNDRDIIHTYEVSEPVADNCHNIVIIKMNI